MTIYDYNDYKAFLRDVIGSMPRRGHGVARRLADHLRVNSVAVSQVLSGDRHFTPEQALQIGEFFALDDASKEYFVQLVFKDRAGTVSLANYHNSQLTKLREEYLKLRSRIVHCAEISDEDKGIYYSNWYYAAIRQVCAIGGSQTVDSIAQRLGINPALVKDAVDFLVSRGLCSQNGDFISRGAVGTFIDASSRHINNHRRNWRLKGLERLTEPGDSDYFFSSLYAISANDFQAIRAHLADLIGENSKRVKAAKAEHLACINVDWFKL